MARVSAKQSVANPIYVELIKALSPDELAEIGEKLTSLTARRSSKGGDCHLKRLSGFD
jgi:hypothetical protein